jgi:signal transduction histidine kinase
MKQRIGIAQALLNDPQILIVDEPTAGLDPEERVRFRNLLSELSGERIIILSTHIVPDVEATATDIALISGGRLVAHATPEELQPIRDELAKIEPLLSTLFGDAYAPGPTSQKALAEAADLVELHFDGIIEEWGKAVAAIFGQSKDNFQSGRNAMIRFIWHLRDRRDLSTYVYLRKHCQEGMLSRALPSQFNVVHIALKEIILSHVRAALRGQRMELVRDAVVAAIDERRLMVGQFYIESRERALRASEEKYRNSINHAPDPMYEIEPETWKVLAVNSAAERRWKAELGGDALSPVGMRILDIAPPGMQGMTLKHLQQVMEKGSDETLDVPLGPLYFDIHSALIPYGNRQFIQMILHDVTHRREMLDQLVKAERLAVAGTFAAGVAHEVNNPLASISSLVQSLLSNETDQARQGDLRTILSQITRISTTLKDLVNFARPSNAQRRLLDLNEMVSETLRLVTYNKRFDGIRIESSLAPDLKPVFAGDNEIQQVLLNLLLNAADATQREGAVIRVVTENKRPAGSGGRVKQVVLRVIDNGIGIPREHLERVFDPFFTTKPAGSGSGLGLSLCQRIVLANHGSIRVASEVGAGTTVTIFLPVEEVEVQDKAAASQSGGAALNPER